MAKEVAAFIKLQIKGGAANPSPPVGPALGSKGVNIMDFCKQFNARTQDKAGESTSCHYHRIWRQVVRFRCQAAARSRTAQGGSKASEWIGRAEPQKKVGQVTWDQVKAIAEDKMPDLNCFTLESAMRMVAGTARSMGINVVGEFPSL